MYKLLIVDDESKLREVIKEYANFHDFDVDEAENGQIAVDLVKSNTYDTIVMDIMMPVKDGYTAAQEIREISNTPIILLSARDKEYDKLFGFQLGIDDYVVKPFSPKELIARINAVIMRYERTKIDIIPQQNLENTQTELADSLDFFGVHIDRLGRSVLVDKEKIELTPKEFDLLLYLGDNVNIALSRETLLKEIWGEDFFGDDRTIDTHIKNLRSHLGVYRDLIVTLRGVGYKLSYEEDKS